MEFREVRRHFDCVIYAWILPILNGSRPNKVQRIFMVINILLKADVLRKFDMGLFVLTKDKTLYLENLPGLEHSLVIHSFFEYSYFFDVCKKGGSATKTIFMGGKTPKNWFGNFKFERHDLVVETTCEWLTVLMLDYLSQIWIWSRLKLPKLYYYQQMFPQYFFMSVLVVFSAWASNNCCGLKMNSYCQIANSYTHLESVRQGKISFNLNGW